MEIFFAVTAFAIVFVVTAVVAVVALRWDPVARRLRGLEDEDSGGSASSDSSILRWEEKDPRGLPQWRRTIEKLGRAILGTDPVTQKVRRTAIRRRLTWAGYNNPRAVFVYLGAKALTAFGFGYAFFLYTLASKRIVPNMLLISAALGVIGFFLPNLWLRSRIKKRQLVITNALPDVLDLLLICVESGLALDTAIARVSDPGAGKPTPLHDELIRMHLEFRAGRPRVEALHALGERTGCEEVRRIASAFAQTEKLGASLANTLRIHAEGARIKRRHRAEKAAYQAPLKMMFPIVLFLFPAIFVVTLAPAALKILEVFGGMSMHR